MSHIFWVACTCAANTFYALVIAQSISIVALFANSIAERLPSYAA